MKIIIIVFMMFLQTAALAQSSFKYDDKDLVKIEDLILKGSEMNGEAPLSLVKQYFKRMSELGATKDDMSQRVVNLGSRYSELLKKSHLRKRSHDIVDLDIGKLSEEEIDRELLKNNKDPQTNLFVENLLKELKEHEPDCISSDKVDSKIETLKSQVDDVDSFKMLKD